MKELDIVNPYNLEKIDSLPIQGETEALQILDRSYRIYNDKFKWLPSFRRIEILEEALALFRPRVEELALAAAREGGKPYVDSKVEVERGLEGIKVAIRELAHSRGREVPMGITKSSANRMAYTRLEPRGVVFAISAFNHPFNLIIHQVITAVATGCPVIVKPALTTPLSCKTIVDTLHQAGLPLDWCQMLICENEVAEKIVTDTRISFLTFIGSGKVGWYLRSKLAPGATCALEHGGAAPVIFDETANIERAIPLLVKGGYYHAGQVCVSVQRIYVHESIHKKFTQKFCEAAEKLSVGDPKRDSVDVGPLILPREVDRVHSWVEEGLSGRGELLLGGKKVSDTCYAPTVVLHPSDEANLSKKEIFGPVVNIYPYQELKDAVARANNVEFAFQAAIFTNRLDWAFDVATKLEGLVVMVNDHTAFRVDWMPFGGYRQSGLGVGGIGYTMRDMTIEKVIIINRG